MLTEIGPPAVDRAGAAEDRGRELAERQHDVDRLSLGVFVALYVALLVLDIWLMRRYAGREPSDEPDEEVGEAVPAVGY